jgi:hypothetical protein
MTAQQFRILAITVALPTAAAVGGALVHTQQSGPAAAPQAAQPRSDLGFTDTPMLPGLPYHVHDPARPHPPVVTPGAKPGDAPSDAIVLFGGSDLSKWAHRNADGTLAAAKWIVRDGYFEVAPKTAPLVTRESFGDVQLHLEWTPPAVVSGNSQGRGNSGVFLMGLYEVQVLDSYANPTYADGQAAALYGQWPPLANAARPPGKWQTYDVVFEAPRFEGNNLVSPAYMTVFWNGVAVHNRKALLGATVYREVARYTPHAAELPLMLQDHDNPVRYRNVWVRRLSGYDQRAAK